MQLINIQASNVTCDAVVIPPHPYLSPRKQVFVFFRIFFCQGLFIHSCVNHIQTSLRYFHSRELSFILLELINLCLIARRTFYFFSKLIYHIFRYRHRMLIGIALIFQNQHDLRGPQGPLIPVFFFAL